MDAKRFGPVSAIVLVCLLILPLFASATDGNVSRCISPALAAVRIGFTLTHETVELGMDSECAESAGGGANLDGRHNIVGHYHNREVREGVQKFLSTMAAQGASVMRTIVWYKHAEDEAMANRRADPLGLLIATKGKLPEQGIQNLINYIDDARIAGYKRFFIVLSSQGKSNPKCKQGEWGQCYDSSFEPATWSVASQVVQAVRRKGFPGIEVIFDISPESCFDPLPKLLVDKNLERFSRYMIGHYKEEFGDGQFIASCGAGNANRAISGLSGQAHLFREMNVRPASIDIHVYDIDPKNVRRLLLEAGATARELGVVLDVAETYYDHPNIFVTAADLVSKGLLPQLRDLMIFPRRNNSPCQIGVRAPYAMNLVDDHFQRRAASGQTLAICR